MDTYEMSFRIIRFLLSDSSYECSKLANTEIIGDHGSSWVRPPYVVPYKESDLPHVDWETTDQYYEYYHGYTHLEKNGVSLKAGEEANVTITTPLEKLKWYNPVYRRWELEKMTYPVYVGNSAADEDLVKTEITIE